LVTRKNWALKYPELAARLEEAQKRGWSYTGPPLPKMKENPTQDELHQKTLDETGFWGAQGAGAIVMARSTGRFLLPLRSRHVEQPGTWGVWGGAIDANEVPATAAKREIVEEAGYEGEIEIVPLVVFESGSFRYHNHLAIVEEEFTPQLNWETERAEWFEFEDFPQPLHFGLLYMLENSTHLIDDKYWLANPMAPGYQSYGWTTQDWRSIKVNNKGEIDYSEKCGAEGTQTASGKPRLCLPAIVVKSLIRTESGKEVIRKQARKKARAKKGERIPWHPRIKKLWKKLEEKTVEDRPKKNGVLPVKHGGRFATPSFVHDDPNKKEEELHNSRKQSRDDYDESVKAYMRKNLNRLWKWDTNFKEGADGVKEKAMLKKAKAHAKKEVGAPKSCNSDCLYCAREQWKKNPSPLMRIPKIVLEDKITPAMLDSKSQIFLFGDNEQRKGKGGQAKVMRGHAKAYGIRTKRAPSMSESAFWTDKTYKSNIKMMADDFLAAFMAASDGDHELVIPSAGIGTGMAQLKQRAPRTYKWLNSFLRNLIAGEDPALLKQWRMN